MNDSETQHKSKLHLLVIATGPRDTSWAQALVVRLSKNPRIETRALVDDVVPRLSQTIIVMLNRSLGIAHAGSNDDANVEYCRQQAFEQSKWADLAVCVPLDADGIAKMLAGMADTFVGEVLRGWSPRKPMLLVPGMSVPMWENPITHRQLDELRSKWNWLSLMSPITWEYEGSPTPRRTTTWSGFNEVLAAIQDHANIMGLGEHVVLQTGFGLAYDELVPVNTELPSELWSTILNFTGDWELAKALGVYTNLPMPSVWVQLLPDDQSNELQIYEYELMWTLLTSTEASTCRKLSQAPLSFDRLPYHFRTVALRFALVQVLEYLSINRPDLYRDIAQSFLMHLVGMGHPPSVVLLDFWIRSGWTNEDMTTIHEFVTIASKRGFVNVLEWWHRQPYQNLRLIDNKEALEQASANGQTTALEWWRKAAAVDGRLVLAPGRSMLLAAKYGHQDVLQWWKSSGIAVGYRDIVA